MRSGAEHLGYVGTTSRQLRWIVGSTVACGLAAAALLVYGVGNGKRREEETASDILKPVETAPTDPENEETLQPSLVAPPAAPPKEAVLSPTKPAFSEPLEKTVAPAGPAYPEPVEEEVALAELPAAESTEEPGPPDEPKPEPTAGEHASTNGKLAADQAFLELWSRVPEFENRLMALLANWQSGPSPLERRRGVDRLPCSLESVCASSVQRWKATITNLSVGGAELHLADYVEPNTRLALVPVTHQAPVTGRVTWALPQNGEYRVGLCFDSDPETLSRSWVAETLLDLGSGFLLKRAPRRYVRVPTDVPSCLVTDEGKQVEVTLKDVSLGGCLLQSNEPLEVEELTLRLGTVDCRGIIVNHRGSAESGWSHHVHFAPLGPFETLKLLRTISVLLKATSSQSDEELPG